MSLINERAIQFLSHPDFIEFEQQNYQGIIHKNLVPIFEELDLDYFNKNKEYITVLRRKRNTFYKISASIDLGKSKIQIVIKQTAPENFLKKIRTFFQRCKAEKSFKAAFHLLKNELDTPLPLGYLFKRKYGFIQKSFYITERVTDFIKLRKYLRNNLADSSKIREMMICVADYVRKMHQCGFAHMDLNLANFLFIDKSKGTRLTLIDLNRSIIKKKITPLLRIRDISRLYWKQYRDDFFNLYCTGDKTLQRLRWFYNLYYRWRILRKRIKKIF